MAVGPAELGRILGNWVFLVSCVPFCGPGIGSRIIYRLMSIGSAVFIAAIVAARRRRHSSGMLTVVMWPVCWTPQNRCQAGASWPPGPAVQRNRSSLLPGTGGLN
jgi:hypothetical protein